MVWHGDKNLPKMFILYLGLAAVSLGEVFPPAQLLLSGKFSSTTKQPTFDFSLKGIAFFAVISFVYFVIASLFWLLFKYLNWKIVAVIAAVFGMVSEPLLFKSHDPGVLHSVILFVAIVWPIILCAPYLIYKLVQRKLGDKAIVRLLMFVAVLIVVGLVYTGFAYRHWLSAHPGVKNSVSAS